MDCHAHTRMATTAATTQTYMACGESTTAVLAASSNALSRCMPAPQFVEYNIVRRFANEGHSVILKYRKVLCALDCSVCIGNLLHHP